LIPTIRIWKKPEKNWLYVLIFGIICYAFVFSINQLEMDEYFPKTTGMIVLLIGSLSILNAIYVWLVVIGPLSEKQVLEQE
jgi:vacuolar-type H+-ATPase subunit I/STV1